MTTFYLDCEFDGHNGPLLSMALVPNNQKESMHITVTDVTAKQPWVIEHVLPVLAQHAADKTYYKPLNEVGATLLEYVQPCSSITVVADSVVDIARFCTAISTNAQGEWQSVDLNTITFVVRDVICYPSKIANLTQHNAWCDAIALRAACEDLI